MNRILCILSIVVLAWTSCVKPNKVILGEDNKWVVFAMMGEDKEPVFYVYGSQPFEGRLRYNFSAEISITDVETNKSYFLSPRINDTLKYYDTHEYPFRVDIFDEIVYYSSDEFRAEANKTYEVEIVADGEVGNATVELPAQVDFSGVELIGQPGNEKIAMTINDMPEENYYKWEISVNQNFEIEASTIDSISGDTTLMVNDYYYSNTQSTPNYITDNILADENNIFFFDLSLDLPELQQFDSSVDIEVRLRNYSKAVIDYFNSVRAQQLVNSSDPFVESVSIISNIDGMLGLVGSFNYSEPVVISYQP